MMQLRGPLPGAAGRAAGHPRARARRRGRSQLGPGAERFQVGDRVMGIVGGGGQAELAVVHERDADAGPAEPRLAGRPAACPRSSPPRTTRSSPRPAALPASGCSSTAPPAAWAPRRSSSGARPARASPRPSATRQLREQVAELGADGDRPEGFVEHGPFDVILELVGAPNLADNLNALDDRRPDRRDRDRRRREGRAQPRRADGASAARSTASTLRPRPLEEKALTARAVERSVLPLLDSRASRCRSPRPSARAAPTPTSASRRRQARQDRAA